MTAISMTANGVYEASPTKHGRATKAEMQARRAALYRITREHRPATVRQVFYLATIEGLIAKTEAGYNKAQRTLADMRRAGELPYGWLADNTRWQRKPRTYDSVADAVEATAAHYRRALWSNADTYTEIWIEKDALAGAVLPVTSSYDVPLMVARGYASLSFLHSAAEHIRGLSVPVHLFHLGDFDPSGQDAAAKIEATLREMAPMADIRFQRLAVTPAQIEEWSLPSRPTKTTDSRAKSWTGGESVELDAIPPGQLRKLVETAIVDLVEPRQLEVLMAAEESERDYLASLAATVRENGVAA